MANEPSSDESIEMSSLPKDNGANGVARDSKHHLDEALQLETVGVIFFTFDGQITEANDAFLTMSGFSRDDAEAGRLRWDALTPPEWMPASEQAIAELKATGHTVPYEKEYVRKDGSRWWGLFAAKALNDRSGMEYILDITERKQAEEEALAFKDTLAADLAGMTRLYELNKRLLVAGDLNTILQEILAAAIEFTKTGKGTIQLVSEDGTGLEIAVHLGLGRSFVDHFSFDSHETTCLDDSHAKQRVIIEDVVEEPRLQGTVILDALLDDGIRAVQSTPLITRTGQLVGMLSTHFAEPHRPSEDELRLLDLLAWLAADFIERSRAEAKLRESEQRFRAIYDGTYEYIGLLAPDGTLLDTNRASLEFAGNSREEVIGRPFWETPWFTYTPGAPESLRQAIKRAAEGEFVRYELPLRRPSGDLVTFDFSLYPIRNERGETVLIVPEGRDISEQKRAAAERERARREAEEAVRARDVFLSIASHELRNPVTSIKASAQLMRRLFKQGRLDEESGNRYTSTLLESSNRLAMLLDDLLDVSRLQSGKLRMHKQTTNLAELVRETISLQSAAIDERRLQFELEDGHALPLDRERIRQVLVNVLDNAIKYSPEGGAIQARLTFDDKRALFHVRDQGIGLPADALESVFEPFGRASNAAESSIPGMGLGLYICRRIVEAHGGRLWAESEGEGKGTTMCLWLPIEDGEVDEPLSADNGHVSQEAHAS